MSKKFEDAKGRAKQAAGDLTDDERLKREGSADRAGAKVKDAVDRAADKAKELVDKTKKKTSSE